jgi:predicted nucleic acid-binding protein
VAAAGRKADSIAVRLLNAAIAITRGMALATGNTAHFERVQRLGHPLARVDWRS